jgi:hypothetical protein
LEILEITVVIIVQIVGAVTGIITEHVVIFSPDHVDVGIDLVVIFSRIIVVVAADPIGIRLVCGEDVDLEEVCAILVDLALADVPSEEAVVP